MPTAAAPVSINTEMEIGRQVWPPGQERKGWGGGASLIGTTPTPSLELPLAKAPYLLSSPRSAASAIRGSFQGER